MAGMSEAAILCSVADLWKEAIDALVDSGGVGMPRRLGVDLGVLAKVPSPSAMVGDWRGDCTWLRLDSRLDSIIGGRRGVEARSRWLIGSSISDPWMSIGGEEILDVLDDFASY
jgi:hypothetical protein